MNEAEDDKSPVGERDAEFGQTSPSDVASPKA
jgi:hypothetical protein